MRITVYTSFFVKKKKTPKRIVHSFRAHTPVCLTLNGSKTRLEH